MKLKSRFARERGARMLIVGLSVVLALCALTMGTASAEEVPTTPTTTAPTTTTTIVINDGGVTRVNPTLANATMLAKTSWGAFTCGTVTCTWYWDLPMTRMWQWFLGGSYSNTKAAFFSLAMALACFPISGPAAVVCGGLGLVGFTQMQDTLNLAVTMGQFGGCAAVKYAKLPNGLISPIYTEAVPLSDPYCFYDA